MPKATTIAFLLAAVGTNLVAHSSSALAQSQPCRLIEYERYAYTICEVDLRKQTIRLARLLPACRERPRGCRAAAKQDDEIAPSYT
jgi:hypothetical protein